MNIYRNPALSWEQYLLLEQNFLGYLRYVPLDSKHYKVWSYQLGSLTMDIGSVIDSFFRNSVSSSTLNSILNIQNYRTKMNKLTINDYHDIFKTHYKLSTKYVYELKNYSKIVPYSRWMKNKPPFWWTDYNKVKHDRFKNRERASLKSTLYALSGLFLLNVTSPKLIPYLIDINVIHTMGVAKGVTISRITNDKITPREKTILEPIHAKSELFGYIYYNKNSLKFNTEDEKKILSPLNKGFFGSWTV